MEYKYWRTKQNIRLLMIGPMPSPIGGRIVSFKYPVNDLNKMEGQIIVTYADRSSKKFYKDDFRAKLLSHAARNGP